jgi:hypothetical protein
MEKSEIQFFVKEAFQSFAPLYPKKFDKIVDAVEASINESIKERRKNVDHKAYMEYMDYYLVLQHINKVLDEKF